MPFTIGTRARELRFQIFKHDDDWADALVPEVEYTFDDSDIAQGGIGQIGGQIIRPADGRAESRTWSLEILDEGEQFTAILADADGRGDLLFRLGRLQYRDDVGIWTSWVTHRIVEVSTSPDDSAFRVTLQDERLRERRATIFAQADTTSIYPAGLTPERILHNFWAPQYPYPPASIGRWIVRVALATDVTLECIGTVQNPNKAPGVWPVAQRIIEEDVKEDVTDSEGAFEHLRFFQRTGLGTGNDREIAYFDGGKRRETAVIGFRDDISNVLRPTLYWPAHGLSVGNVITGWIYAPTRPPDRNMPLHIGFDLPPNRINGVTFGGSSGDYLWAPWDLSMDPSGDIDLRVDVQPTDYTPTSDETIFARWESSILRVLLLRMKIAGTLEFSWTEDGTTIKTQVSSAYGISSGRYQFRVTLDVDNGSSQHVVTFYKRLVATSGQKAVLTSDVNWTEISSHILAGVTSVETGSIAKVELASHTGGTAENFDGEIFRALLLDGLDATGDPLVDVWLEDPNRWRTSFTRFLGLRKVLYTLAGTYTVNQQSGFDFLFYTHQLDLMQLTKRLYDGEFQDATKEVILIRYSSEAFSWWDPVTNPVGLIKHPRLSTYGFGLREQNANPQMDEYLEDRVYGPLGVTPFVDADGEIAPRITRLPAAEDLDVSSLTEVADADITQEGAAWRHTARELVTKVRVLYQPEVSLSLAGQGVIGGAFNPGFDHSTFDFTVESTPLDLIFQQEQPIVELEHDLIARLGVREKEFVLPAHDRFAATPIAESAARDHLQRFGDGPQWLRFSGLYALEGLREGDFCLVSSTAFPAFHEASKTGSRIVQVIGRVDGEIAPDFEALDVGEALQPLATPGITAVLNSGNNFWVDITISSLPTAASYRVAAAAGDASAEAGDLWQTIRVGNQDELFTHRGFPAEIPVAVRVQAFQEGRISSPWSASVVVTPTGIVDPTSLAVETLGAKFVTITWTPGDFELQTEIQLDAGSGFEFLALLPPGTDRYGFWHLLPSTAHTARIRHIRESGFGSWVSQPFTTIAVGADSAIRPPKPLIWVGTAP